MESLSSCDESQPLLLPSSVGRSKMSHRANTHHFLKDICLPSKAAVVLVCLAVVVGAVHAVFTCVFTFIAIFFIGGKYISESVAIFASYLGMTLAVFLYPLSGFVADIKYGRYRVMFASMTCIVISLVFMSGASGLLLAHPYASSPFQWSHVKIVLLFILIVLFGASYAIGLISYFANFIQFGLDQLMEAPSEYSSLFVHWVMWADSLACAVIVPMAATLTCHSQVVTAFAGSIPIVCFVLLIVILIIICCKRRWFHTEPGQDNPYKLLIKILNFAWKHKYPLRRSAFTYCDDDIPSRLDFAKERFGGPYTTEQVENVKTFIQIFIVLLAIGPVFVINVSSDTFGLPLIGIHIAQKGRQFCNFRFVLLESGSLRYITSAVAFPVYILVMFSCMKRKRPRIFTRLVIGIFFSLTGVLSILITDVFGHAQIENNANHSSLCMFAIRFDQQNFGLNVPSLGMHWASLIPINILLGIGPLLVITTVFEFIAAQSPLSMKGLIVGLFFTITGFFQLLSSFALLPFSLKEIWLSKHMEEHPPVTNCGFGYFLFVCVVATIGLILFLIAAKRYKYRERGDRPFDQRFAIHYFERVIENREQVSD